MFNFLVMVSVHTHYIMATSYYTVHHGPELSEDLCVFFVF